MNRIYIYDGQFEQGEDGWPMIKAAASIYGGEAGLDDDFEAAEILREEKGKPYFVDIPVEFSLTHSGQLWMCMFSSKPCGLDLQVVKDCRFEEIAARQFTAEEQHYVELWGLEGFFDIWVRKEALCKLTGQGIFSEMPSVVSESADLLEHVSAAAAGDGDSAEYWFTEIEISPELKCAVCTGEQTEVEMRILG